jgi:hypothetical protein
MAIAHAIDHCLLCLSRDLQVVVPLRALALSTPAVHIRPELVDDPATYAAVPLALNLCLDCGQVQVTHRPDSEFEYRNFVYKTAMSLGLAEHYEAYVDTLVETGGLSSSGFVLEIGSNDGTLLKVFARRGMRVLGVEPAERIAAEATSAGFETLPEFFTEALAREIRAERGPADVVVANFVSANLPDMVDFANGLRTALAPDGIAVIETQYGCDVVDRLLVDTIYHEHVSYYNVAPLVAHYRRHGLDVVDVQRVPTKGGSIRLVLVHAGTRQAGTRVAAMAAEEVAKGAGKPAYYASLVRRLDAIRARVHDQLDAAGGEVAGWGVSLGTSTLLAQLELTSRVRYLFDDDPTKEAELRGHEYRIPVLPASELVSKMPGAVVIFAWRYAAPILKRHRNYLERGGAFIVPLPQVSVLRGSDAVAPAVAVS